MAIKNQDPENQEFEMTKKMLPTEPEAEKGHGANQIGCKLKEADALILT